MSVVVVVVISASCAVYGVSSLFAKLSSLNNNFSVNYMIVFRQLNILKYGLYNHFRVDFLSASE